MIPELGLFALVIGLIFAFVQSVVPLYGALNERSPYSPMLMASSRHFATAQFVFVALSFLCLVITFINDDFSVKYVANHSNTLLPTAYKISAVWGGHEGSLLLWMLILSGWSFAVAIFSASLPLVVLARVLSVMGMISIGFMLFIVFLLPLYIPAAGDTYNPTSPFLGSSTLKTLYDANSCTVDGISTKMVDWIYPTQASVDLRHAAVKC